MRSRNAIIEGNIAPIASASESLKSKRPSFAMRFRSSFLGGPIPIAVTSRSHTSSARAATMSTLNLGVRRFSFGETPSLALSFAQSKSRSIFMNQWNIGDVKITRIVESEGAWPGTWLMPDATEDRTKKERSSKGWLADFTNDKGLLGMSIHALVLESKGKRIM